MRGNWSAAMPMPVSFTDATTSLPCRSAASRMRPPRSMYFALLLRRLENTCASRVRSASTMIGCFGSMTVSSWPRWSIMGRLVSTALVTTAESCTCSLRSSSLPLLMRLKSSKSSTRRTICSSWRPIMERACSWASRSGESRMTCKALRIGASGLRSSWANVARNSSLRWSASDRSAAKRRRSSSSRRRSVTSWLTVARPTDRPVASVRVNTL